MPSLKDMRNQISSVKATQKITKAMQMVAAAKLRRATESAENARPYALRMGAVIANLAAGVSGPSAPRLLVGTGRQGKQVQVIAVGKKGRDQLRRQLGAKMVVSYDLSAQRNLSLAVAQPIADKV